jgi:hypothetical protein
MTLNLFHSANSIIHLIIFFFFSFQFRDAKLKRRGLTQSSVSSNSNSRFDEDSENQNPNSSTPPVLHAKPMKAAIKSSTESEPPRLKNTVYTVQ